VRAEYEKKLLTEETSARESKYQSEVGYRERRREVRGRLGKAQLADDELGKEVKGGPGHSRATRRKETGVT